jgi:flavodoxin
MKIKLFKKIAMSAAVIATTFLAGCSSTSSTSSSEEISTREPESTTLSSESNNLESSNSSEADMASTGKMLILYFSWSNNTKTMAGYIHDEIGGDMEQIVPTVAYPEVYNDVADYAKEERDNNARPKFNTLIHNPENYDTIFVGYPVWWYTIPMIIHTLFETYDFSGKTIVPFNTHEGSGDGGTYETIQEIAPKATLLKGLPIRGGDIGKDSAKEDVKKWLKEIGLK